MTLAHKPSHPPEAVYGCANVDCATEVSYPPNMLRWWDGYVVDDDEGLVRCAMPGWWCENCREQYVWPDQSADDHLGPRLDGWLAGKAVAA